MPSGWLALLFPFILGLTKLNSLFRCIAAVVLHLQWWNHSTSTSYRGSSTLNQPHIMQTVVLVYFGGYKTHLNSPKYVLCIAPFHHWIRLILCLLALWCKLFNHCINGLSYLYDLLVLVGEDIQTHHVFNWQLSCVLPLPSYIGKTIVLNTV